MWGLLAFLLTLCMLELVLFPNILILETYFIENFRLDVIFHCPLQRWKYYYFFFCHSDISNLNFIFLKFYLGTYIVLCIGVLDVHAHIDAISFGYIQKVFVVILHVKKIILICFLANRKLHSLFKQYTVNLYHLILYTSFDLISHKGILLVVLARF